MQRSIDHAFDGWISQPFLEAGLIGDELSEPKPHRATLMVSEERMLPMINMKISDNSIVAQKNVKQTHI